MRLNASLVIFFLVLFFIACIQAVTAGSPVDTQNSGIVIPSDVLSQNQTGEIAVADILVLLNQSGAVNLSTPASVAILQVKPGAAYSPNALRQAPEVLYLLAGSANISADAVSLNASAGDTVFVPAGSVMKVENTGQEPLRFFSVLSGIVPETEKPAQVLYKKAQGSVKPVIFGNESDKTLFSVERIMDTNWGSLPLSFDLALITLPAGNTIGDHYVESGQTGYVLDGAGNVTVGCVSHPITPGDLFYIPQSEVQKMTADSDLHFMLLTDPFYKPEKDFPVNGAC